MATIGRMPDHARHDHAEAHFRALLEESGLPQPDEVAHLRRCLIFPRTLLADDGFATTG